MNAPYERSEAQEEAYQERWQAEMDNRADIARKEREGPAYQPPEDEEYQLRVALVRVLDKKCRAEMERNELRERVEQLEGENGWLRNQLDDLRAQVADNPAPKVLIAGEAS